MTSVRPSTEVILQFPSSCISRCGAICSSILLALVLLSASTSPAAADTSPNNFKTICTLAGVGTFDPITFPGQSNAGHQHEFFGQMPTPSSTGFTLKSKGRGPDGTGLHTTCEDREDTAAYWVPTLYFDGVRVPPKMLVVYYRRVRDMRDSNGVEFNKAKIFPTDFRFIAGDHDALSPQPQDITTFKCSNHTKLLPYPGGCLTSAEKSLTSHVFFPACWTGRARTTDTDDLAYFVPPVVDQICPPGYGAAVSKLELGVSYGPQRPDCRAELVPGCGTYTLSSGSIYGYHADFLNGWQTGSRYGTLDTLMRDCLNVPDDTPGCGVISTSPPGDAFDPRAVG